MLRKLNHKCWCCRRTGIFTNSISQRWCWSCWISQSIWKQLLTKTHESWRTFFFWKEFYLCITSYGVW